MPGWKRGEYLLTPDEKQAIETALLHDEVARIVHGLYRGRSGIESRLAARYGVSRQRINQIKRKLCDAQLFYHRNKRAFVGRASDGRFFLVDEAVWKRSLREYMLLTGLSHEEAAMLNLEPESWELCIGARGVRYW